MLEVCKYFELYQRKLFIRCSLLQTLQSVELNFDGPGLRLVINDLRIIIRCKVERSCLCVLMDVFYCIFNIRNITKMLL